MQGVRFMFSLTTLDYESVAMKQLRKLQNDAVVEAPDDVSDEEPQTKAASPRDGFVLRMLLVKFLKYGRSKLGSLERVRKDP